MADGTINNAITQKTCDNWRRDVNAQPSDTIYHTWTDKDNTLWCGSGSIGRQEAAPSNCQMRVMCHRAGATGADSWCSDKVA
ncbi:hypothetical protein LX32DRAFT_638108 [Colletotrichum zoysiae]|uniref:Uncharacterized protein n=1 Tax=Colletotrichum zoysiae TaxID=1216348 RepID=A0AAD9HKD4_9PEZI|nr:hypothetical protein LX32DRAFT_638108 [Colletotrichum zoysiae]